MTETDISPYVTDWNAPVFSGQAQEDVHMWISRIRYGLKLRHVPRSLWVAIALHFLGEEPREVLNDVRRTIAQLPDQEGKEEWDWDWETFTRALVRIHEQAKKDAEKDSTSITDDFNRFRKKHPYTAAAAGLGLVAAGGITVGPAMFVGALHMAGLTVSGVFGGSIFVAPAAVQALSAGTMALGAWVGFGGDKTTPIEITASVDDSLVKSTASVDDSPVKPTTPVDNSVKISAFVENTAPIDNRSLENTSLVENTSVAESAAPTEITSPVENTASVTEVSVDNTSPVEITALAESAAPIEITSPAENTPSIDNRSLDYTPVKNTSVAETVLTEITSPVENKAPVTEVPVDNTSPVKITALAESAAPIEISSPAENTPPIDNRSLDNSPVENMSLAESVAPIEITFPVEKTALVIEVSVDNTPPVENTTLDNPVDNIGEDPRDPGAIYPGAI